VAVDDEQYHAALEILRHEYRLNLPTPFQKAVFLLFQIFSYGVAISLILGGVSGSELLLSAAFLFFVGILVLFFMNLPLLRKLGRNRRLVSRLGVEPLLRPVWKKVARRKRFRRRLSIAVAVLAAVFFTIGRAPHDCDKMGYQASGLADCFVARGKGFG
jgi:uncharacterized membrane-anchored protein YitT (DUF2179 family)